LLKLEVVESHTPARYSVDEIIQALNGKVSILTLKTIRDTLGRLDAQQGDDDNKE
jgi:hypothetical protein